MSHTEEMSVDEYRKFTKGRKYGNKKVTIDGYQFDSIAEARRYEQLKLMEQAGAISDLRLQPRYELQKAFKDFEGKTQRAITYVLDFTYMETSSDDQLIAEDVKGFSTQLFQVKRKLFLYRYPHIRLRILKM